MVPESKNNATWVDRDTLLVAMAEGEGTVTRSGYAGHRQGMEARNAVERGEQGR